MPAGDPPQDTRKEGETMRQNIVLIAGFFIACIVCAGIPAGAAAANLPMVQEPVQAPAPAPTSTQAAQPLSQQTAQSANPAPGYTPVTSVPGLHEQTAQDNQDTTAADTKKTWWDTIWPFRNTGESTPQVSPGVTQNPTDQQPAPRETMPDNGQYKGMNNQNQNSDKKAIPTSP